MSSDLFNKLPWEGYRDPLVDYTRTWVEDWIDAIGLEIDILDARFISSAARAALLDPTVTPIESPSATLATSTAAPTGAFVKDTILDVLIYAALGVYPVDSNLTVAQKQALAGAAASMVGRKGNRVQILRLISLLTDGAVYGWTNPPWQFSGILPDGASTPGFGSWVPLSGANATIRPWMIGATRGLLLARLFPSTSALGVGFSQFRMGFSSYGESIYPIGARINILPHEHFDSWTLGAPDGWTTAVGATAVINQAFGDGFSVNFEFTKNCIEADLTGANPGDGFNLSQTHVVVNNQVGHRFELDYAYRPTSLVPSLYARITDTSGNNGGGPYYYDPAAGAWTLTNTSIPIPISSGQFVRTRYGFNFDLQAASSTAATVGTSQISIEVFATSDGTATTQVISYLHRVGLYETFDLAGETAAGGERLFWAPLVDSLGRTTFARGGGGSAGVMIETADAVRGSYKALSASSWDFDYQAALSGRGYSSASIWTNLLLGSNDFGGDWVTSSAAVAANAVTSPNLVNTAATAPTITTSGIGGGISQANIVADAHNKSFVAGVWVRNLDNGSHFTDITLGLAAVGGTTNVQRKFTLLVSEGWRWLAMPAATFSAAGDTGKPLTFSITCGAAYSGAVIAVASSYCYDVTGKAGVLHPPICQTVPGSTKAVGPTTLTANVSGTCLHPFILRRMLSTTTGLVTLTVVPTFDGTSQPNGTIFDFGESNVASRVVLRVVSGALQGTIFDAATGTHTASITLVDTIDPVSGQATWRHDTAIDITFRWDTTAGIQLACGNGNASQLSGLPWLTSDNGLTGCGIGNDFTGGAGQFDGTITNLTALEVGYAP